MAQENPFSYHRAIIIPGSGKMVEGIYTLSPDTINRLKMGGIEYYRAVGNSIIFVSGGRAPASQVSNEEDDPPLSRKMRQYLEEEMFIPPEVIQEEEAANTLGESIVYAREQMEKISRREMSLVVTDGREVEWFSTVTVICSDYQLPRVEKIGNLALRKFYRPNIPGGPLKYVSAPSEISFRKLVEQKEKLELMNVEKNLLEVMRMLPVANNELIARGIWVESKEENNWLDLAVENLRVNIVGRLMDLNIPVTSEHIQKIANRIEDKRAQAILKLLASHLPCRPVPLDKKSPRVLSASTPNVRRGSLPPK